MIKYIKHLFNIENDYTKEINNILNNNMNSRMHIDMFNVYNIKINIKNINYNVDYIMFKNKFLTILNNLIINDGCTLSLTFIDLHQEINYFIKKNKIKIIHLEKFDFPNLLKLQLNLCNIKDLKLDLKDFYHDGGDIIKILKYVNEMQYLESLCYEYNTNQLKTIMTVLTYNTKIKHLQLITGSNHSQRAIYKTVFELKEFFKYNNTLTHFTCVNGLNFIELFEIFGSLTFNKTLQSFTSLNPISIIIDKKIFSNFIIHNYTLNTIIVNKQKFSNYKSEINLDFHYNNINFIYS